MQSIGVNAGELDYRIYVVDDGVDDGDRNRLYADLEKAGHSVIRLPFDMGASAARNAALLHVDEPYVLRMDDDFVFTPDTSVDRMLALLKARPQIGAVADLEIQRHRGRGVRSGQVSAGQGRLDQIGGTLWKIPFALERVEWQETAGVRFSMCDYCRNFLLIRRELFDDVRWDDRLKIRGEHIDFMLQIRRNTDWGLAFTPDSVHEHAGPSAPEQPQEYFKFRYRNGGFQEILQDKWGFKRIRTDRIGGSSRLRRTWSSWMIALAARWPSQ